MNRHFSVGQSDHLLTCIWFTESWPGARNQLCVWCNTTSSLWGVLGWAWIPQSSNYFSKSCLSSLWIRAGGNTTSMVFEHFLAHILRTVTSWSKTQVAVLSPTPQLEPGQRAILVKTLWTWLCKVRQSMSAITREAAWNDGNQDSAWFRCWNVATCVCWWGHFKKSQGMEI